MTMMIYLYRFGKLFLNASNSVSKRAILDFQGCFRIRISMAIHLSTFLDPMPTLNSPKMHLKWHKKSTTSAARSSRTFYVTFKCISGLCRVVWACRKVARWITIEILIPKHPWKSKIARLEPEITRFEKNLRNLSSFFSPKLLLLINVSEDELLLMWCLFFWEFVVFCVCICIFVCIFCIFIFMFQSFIISV